MALTANALTRRFGDRIAIENVSFALEAGEVFALLGPNGAGKTTTLRILAGLIAPSSGSVHLDGQPLDTASPLRSQIGLLTEAPGLWDRLSVRQNLLVYARLHGLTAPDDIVNEVLDLFEMRDRAEDLAAQLSKGLKQRVALARTLLHNPSIVLLDEPTAGLDPASAREVRALIVRLREQGRAVLLCTHNLDEVERVADRVAILRTRLLAVDTPGALRARLFGARVRVLLAESATRFADMLTSAGVTDVKADGSAISVGLGNGSLKTPQLVKLLVDLGALIESVTPEEQPLEDVYLRMVDAERGRA